MAEGAAAVGGAGVLAAASQWRGCCYPILTFLHVPGKMTKPLWLMMGTAFTFRTHEMVEATYGQPAAPSSLLLTAKHSFSPWDYTKDASQLKIPKEYQKPRFVIGRVYRTDADGRAVAADAVGLRLLAHHPIHDVALLAVDAASLKLLQCATYDSPAHALDLAHEALPLCKEPYPAASDGLLIGFRGAGRLGELDTLDPSVLQRLPPHEREALIKDLQDVEGKQRRATTTVSVLDARGMCKGVGDLATCYHGMSGGPLVTTNGQCAGVLYGHHPDAPGCIGYTPCADFAGWLEEEVQRYRKRCDLH
ncbi:hypothetical protein, conserved [Leishmania donovani]|uniref:Trypsin-like peptidase domain containing protein, putative n=1 Tax=Leishmania donovani TaxID=5661 RepID=A0A3Q8IHS3_LEIDO|nr:hypothetical protein, conserved [Leishmania donovani]AYU82315.1 Trypsin-like peptidase domain containing protein, putative [Leishmania donovani]TPP42952.1 Trypsin-like peptidase domain family protein [Leishmania donovani]CBZ37469.1 hypothetical protein, conserved [Leishmania donovani]